MDEKRLKGTVSNPCTHVGEMSQDCRQGECVGVARATKIQDFDNGQGNIGQIPFFSVTPALFHAKALGKSEFQRNFFSCLGFERLSNGKFTLTVYVLL